MCGREKEDEKEEDLIRVCVCVFVGVLAALADQEPEPELDEREHCNFCSSATKIDVLQMKRQKVCPQLDEGRAGQREKERGGEGRLRKQTRSKSKRLKNGKMCMAKEKH